MLEIWDRKRCISILLCIVILFSFTACRGLRDERELSVFELRLSDEKKKELLVSYRNSLVEMYGEENVAPVREWDGNDSRLSFVGDRYYGTFGDCTVWLSAGNTTEGIVMEIAGCQFFHPNGGRFNATRNGECKRLSRAYEAGWISDEDIAIVAQRHKEYNDAIYAWLNSGSY